MASWVLRAAPLMPWSRMPLRLDFPAWTLGHAWSSKHYFSSPILGQETPAMVELKKQPYPSTPLDSSLFEDMSEDYVTHPSSLPMPTYDINPSGVLLRLVREHKYDDANHVHAELTEMGVSIHPSSAYQHAAIHALRREYENAHERLTAFVKWWSLIPAGTHPECISTEMWHALFREDALPDLPILTHFALISASKGYTTAIDPRLISLVIRYAPPLVSRAFLEELQRTSSEYLRTASNIYPSREIAQVRYTKRFRWWFSIAIRAHCMSGRPEEAVRTLQSARSYGISITSFTYEFLLTRLRARLDLPLISVVEALRQSGSDNTLEITQSQPLYSPILGSPTLENPSEITFTDNHSLAVALRLIRNGMSTSRYPLPGTLASFIGAYKEAGRTVALDILYRQSLRSYQTASMWVLAEMLYYFRRGQHNLVHYAFGHHFHFVGVPPRTRRYTIRTTTRISRRDGFHEFAPLLSVYTQKDKMWPSTHHTALVWRVVALSRPDMPAVERLYAELLEQIARARNPEYAPWPSSAFSATSEFSPYPEAIAPPVQFDAGHFDAFVYVFAHRGDVPRAAAVVQEMYSLGFTPGARTLTVLAAAFARDGDTSRLNQLLDRMEAPAPDAADAAQRLTLPAPNIVTYTAVMRAFLNRHNISEAVAVAERLKKAGYVPGSNETTDQALVELSQFFAAATPGQHAAFDFAGWRTLLP
ncbi:hypothetical protein B0H21DRAFT_35521 [Amylocystis lapponica]|nr:hypothetical protein B0H21DRAFT_35521 [Amylocystis lapponica]